MTKLIQSLTLLAAIVFFLDSLAIAQEPPASVDLSRLVLELKADQADYLPGDLITLTFRIAPRSGNATAPAAISVLDGGLAVWVSTGGSDFAEYTGPGWGVKKTDTTRSVVLNSGESVETSATFLYNWAPPTEHLAPMYRSLLRSGRAERGYAAGRPGTYLLKAVYHDSSGNLESDPVPIYIRLPLGDDAEVWRVLSARPEIGHLLQAGILPVEVPQADEAEVVRSLEALLMRYPSSGYVRHIRSGLQRISDAGVRRRNPMER